MKILQSVYNFNYSKLLIYKIEDIIKMVYADLLNNIFYRKSAKWLIPYVNFLVTFLKRKKIVTTKFNKEFKAYIHTQSDKILIIDKFPWWGITYEKLYQNVINICCWYYVPKLGDIVLDIGAGVGSETIIFSDLIGNTGKVYSVEANPKTFQYLERLCFLNNLKNVQLVNIAIGDKKRKVYVEDKDHHVSNAITDSKENNIPISMINLDEFVKENHLKAINFLKINIEGAEIRAISGMNNSINIIENIAISCHDFLFDNKDKNIKSTIIKFLSEHKFKITERNTGHIVRDNWVYAKKLD